ncbi:MAG TPA: inner membrane-spanning protein YciB [Sphingomicrobium sp.]|nr:inner membrane-spanning protein YciB [Sphingomicrobium sp.]
MSEVKEPHGLMRFLVDFGPIVVFFATYKLSGGGLHGTLVATGGFMVAVLIAIAAALVVFRRVTPMLWLSTVLILGFGSITLYLQDPRYIMMKPTFYYGLMATVLFIGLLKRKPLLRWLFGPIFPGLNEDGWLKLGRNWTLFFIALAIANEVMRTTLTFDTWLMLKFWGVPIVSLLFAAANIPMLLRHGLDADSQKDVIGEAPVE